MFQRINAQKRSELCRRDLKSEVGVTLKLSKMFKTNLKSKIMVAVMVMFGITAFISCEKEAIDNSINPNQEIELKSEIGKYHNIALDLYLSNSVLKPTEINYNNVQDVIIKSLVNYDSKLFDINQINEFAKKSENISSNLKLTFNGSDLKSTTNNFSNIINYLVQNNEISTSLSEQLTSINNNILEGTLNSSEILALVNDLNNNSWNEQDAKYVDAFTQVYNSSYEYWTNAKKLKSTNAGGDGVILADAAGALYGSILSPVWSIIEGAIFSVIANNNQ